MDAGGESGHRPKQSPAQRLTHAELHLRSHCSLAHRPLRFIADSACAQKRLFKPAQFGAYSELFAAFSLEATAERNGAFIVPWGRIGPVPEHLQKAMREKESGGTGNRTRFVEWCEREIAEFLQAES